MEKRVSLKFRVEFKVLEREHIIEAFEIFVVDVEVYLWYNVFMMSNLKLSSHVFYKFQTSNLKFTI